MHEVVGSLTVPDVRVGPEVITDPAFLVTRYVHDCLIDVCVNPIPISSPHSQCLCVECGRYHGLLEMAD